MTASDAHYVGLSDEGDNWRCYTMPDGKTKQWVGCIHRVNSDANHHCNELDKRSKENQS